MLVTLSFVKCIYILHQRFSLIPSILQRGQSVLSLWKKFAGSLIIKKVELIHLYLRSLRVPGECLSYFVYLLMAYSMILSAAQSNGMIRE
jgi:hypothetical protein